MNDIKVLHCSDLHFSAPFAGLNYLQAQQRALDFWKTFNKIREIVAKEKVNLLLISGDLFEQVSITRDQLLRISEIFKNIPDTKIFISPGDHDPLIQDSAYRLIVWPDNVHIFGSQVECFDLPEWNTAVYGCAFSAFQEHSNLIKNFQVQNSNRINIMVLHGEVCPALQQSIENPIYNEDIENSNLDYLAMGHNHSFTGFEKAGKTTWAYSGAPEAREFEGSPKKGVIIGEIGKGFVNLKFREIYSRRYFEVFIDVSAFNSEMELTNEIYQRTKLSSPKENLFRIILTGNYKKTLQLDHAALEQKLEQDFFYIKLLDESIKNDPASGSLDFSLEVLFVQKIKNQMKHATQKEKRLLELALKIGLTAFEQGRTQL